MTFDPESWQRVKKIFHEALQRPLAERDAFVADAASDDPRMLAEVRELLVAHDDAAASQDERELRVPSGPPRTPSVGVGDGPGTVIDRYKILQEIGEGGFGTVYMAEQLAPVRRKVAFKILKAGMDTRQVLARFEAEQQALAMMDHNNIARVYDAGSTVTGRPYFVMELVRGVPITSFCDQANLDTAGRLELFLQVCSAIQHAHQKGIIHRDIKPSNVLVTLHDGVPVPKVIDFGIAKATDHRLTEKTLFTEFRQMIGTPEYMAPEQAEMSGLDVDTRADIYSLGVLLYEILTGTKPFDFKQVIQAGYDAVLQQIREVEPPKPSTRVATLGVQGGTVAKRRGTDVRHLRTTLRGDLDWVVMKALAKDRARRYETANGLAMDLQRYLSHEPVVAGPPTLGYRLRKTLRRNRGAAATAAVVLLSLVGGLAVALWQFREAKHNEEVALVNARSARKNLQLANAREAEAKSNLARATVAEREAREALAAEQAARQDAVGHRLSAQAIALAQEDPSTALMLAIEGAKLAGGDDANIALYTALEHHRLLAEMDGHDAASYVLEISADGRLAISADTTRLVILWDLEERRILHRIDVHDGLVTAVGFTPDARTAFSASSDGTVRLWDVGSGAEAGSLQHPEPVRWAWMHPSGATLFTACADGRVREWDLTSSTERRTVRAFDPAPVATAVSRDGRRLAVLDADMVAWIVDLDEAAPPRRIALSQSDPPGYYNVETWYFPTVELSADGARLLTRNRAGHAALWDSESGDRICEYAGEGRFCGPVRLSPDARRVYLLRRDPANPVPRGEIVDAITGGLHCVLTGADVGERSNGHFSPDGLSLLTVDSSRGSIWSSGNGALTGRLRRDAHSLYSPRFLPDGERIVSGSHQGPLHLWALAAFPERRALTLTPAGAERLVVTACSPDGERAAVVLEKAGEAPSPMVLFDTANGRSLHLLLPDAEPVGHAGFSPDGQRLVVCGGPDGGFKVWEVASRRILVERTGAVHDLPRLSVDGRFLAVRTNGEFVVFDVDGGVELGRVPASWRLPSRLSPDGRTLVHIDGPPGTISLWDVARGERTGLVEHAAFSFDGLYSPDGRYLVTVANDTTARILDARSFDLLGTFRVPTADYEHLAFSPDGRMVAVSAQLEILVFEVPSGRRFARWKVEQGRQDAEFTPDGRSLTVRWADESVRLLPLDPLAYARGRTSEKLTAADMLRYELGTDEERRARAAEQQAGWVSAAALVQFAFDAVGRGRYDIALERLERARATRPRMQVRYHYVDACAHALRAGSWPDDGDGPTRRAADLEVAVAALHRLVEAGFTDGRVIEASPYLAALHDLPAFRALIDALK